MSYINTEIAIDILKSCYQNPVSIEDAIELMNRNSGNCSSCKWFNTVGFEEENKFQESTLINGVCTLCFNSSPTQACNFCESYESKNL